MKRVLVVDDEPHVTRLTKTRLERAGYEVEVRGNGEEALACLEESRFDAMLTDVCMPRMTGRELCDAVRKRSCNEQLFILVITSSAEDELRRWAEDVPNLHFMEKPVSLNRVAERLEEALGDRGKVEE